MKEANNLMNRRSLFWDINENNIEKALHESEDWVIERVFEYGELNDIFDVINLYKKEKVAEVLSKAKLKPMARAMAFLFLDLETNKFEERPLFYK
jgi:hypothetical protein